MLRELLSIFSKADLLRQAVAQTEEMLTIAQEMFAEANARILKKAPAQFSVHKRDKDINQLEGEIRRKVLEHLSISAKQDVVASLVLTTVTGYIERIGDNTKRFTELDDLYSGDFSALPQYETLCRLTDSVGRSFELVRQAFHDEDPRMAEEVFQIHKEVRDGLNKVVKGAYADDPRYDKNAAITEVLFARSLKRINANLKNVATTVTKPFDEIGYTRKLRDDD